MKFKGGMLGVCAVVLALLGTIILGVALSIDETTTTGTGTRDIADITGIVSTSNDPYFTDYNPAYNWTRYYTQGTDPLYTSGISYTIMPTGQSSSYPVYTGTPIDTSGMFSLNTLTGSDVVSSGWNEVRIYRDNSNYSTGTSYTLNPKFTTLDKIANTLKTNTTTKITINAGSGSLDPTRAYIMDNDPNETRFYPSMGSKVETGNDLWWGVGTHIPNHRLETYENSAWTIDVTNMTATNGYNHTTYPAGQVWVAFGGTLVGNGGGASQPLPVALYYTRTDSTMEYMDTSQGVTVNNTGNTVNWSNTYYNNSVQVVLKGTPGAVFSMGWNTYSWDGSAWSNSQYNGVYILWQNDKTIAQKIPGGTIINIGKWNNILLNVDTGMGKITISPITSFIDYNTYTTAPAKEIGDIYTGAFSELAFYTDPNFTSPEMQITNTSVWMNTYGAVFRNATLNPTSYFPDYPSYALDFGSFALIGDSITINNVALPVTGDKITYNAKEYSLKGASIVYDTNVYLNGKEDGKEFSIDLGAIATNDVYFSGVWYVPINFQEVYQTIENAYDWVPYGWGFDYNTAVMVFIGLVVAVMFIAPLMKVKPKALDWVVVVFAGVIGAGLLVV